MRNELEKFHHTVGILVKAYLNDTLKHTNCYACAVGNIIADSLNLKFRRVKGMWHELNWDSEDVEAYWYTYLSGGHKTEEAIEQILATGYSVEEIIKIEKAFEGCDYNDSDEQWMFNGLMAVVDVLADIHKVDLSVKEEAKALFATKQF
jgi:hypothetical protein